MKELSRKNIMSQVIKPDDLPQICTKNNEINNLQSETDPLFLYTIKTENDFQVFKYISSNKILIKYPWFIYVYEKTSLNCEQPVGNPFNLIINSILIIKCPLNQMIKKYFSVDGNFTIVENLSVWTPGKTFLIQAHHDVFSVKRNMKGLKLKTIRVSFKLLYFYVSNDIILNYITHKKIFIFS